jgi:MFS superfamily sulfate permease-like transporter/CRP-like cAMP-binding protein/Ca2+-binding EF-hand superfamily protein
MAETKEISLQEKKLSKHVSFQMGSDSQEGGSSDDDEIVSAVVDLDHVLDDPTDGVNNSSKRRGRRKSIRTLLVKKKEESHGHAQSAVDTSKLPKTWAYTMTWVIDAIIMTLLKYVFCVVGAIIIHDANPLFKPSLSLGIGVQLVSTLITCVITSWKTKIGINISGPDIIAAIFAALWANTLYEMGLPIEEALPTLLFLIFLSTLLMGLIWLLIGYKNVTRIISILPQPVVSGFLGCIGWKVLKYSWKVSTGSQYKYIFSSGTPWVLYLPAVVLGVPLYVLKKKHIGNPMVILPAFLFLPMILFYAIVGIVGTSEADLRTNDWLFTIVPDSNFYDLYVEGYGKMGNVSMSGVLACVPNMIIMIVILVIDSLLKLAATKTGLMMDVDMAHEIKVAGYENIITAFFFGSPGYPQVKFNLLSFGILHNTVDRRIGYVMGISCGVMWVADLLAVNIIPRFVMGFLLVYACLPFIIDNLIMTYFHMTKKDFVAVWVIVLTAVIMDAVANSPLAMLSAVIVGIVISFLIFVLQYARVSVIRDVFSGENYQSKVIRSYWEEALLARVGKRVRMLQLEGFVFFASSSEIIGRVKDLIAESLELSNPARTRYLILDFEHVSNVDFSAIRNFVEIRRMLKAEHIELMLTGLTQRMHEKFAAEGIFEKEGMYNVKEENDLDMGTEKIEDMILTRAARLRHNWLMFDSFIKLHTEAQLKKKFEIFDMALGGDVGHDLYKFAEPKTVKPGDFICEEGKVNNTLYLLQRGRVTSWTASDDGSLRRVRSMRQGAVINDECMFVDLPVAHSCVADQESVLWAITQKEFRQMEVASPKLFLKIHVYILRYASLVRHRLEREINNIDHATNAAKAKKVKHQRRTHLQLASTVTKKIQAAHKHYKEEETWSESHGTVKSIVGDTLIQVDNDHHKHHFEHIHTPDSPVSRRQGSVTEPNEKWRQVKAHLSSVVMAKAVKWFEFHAEDIDHSDVDASQKKLDIDNVQKALMDLGLFPTLKELRKIHNQFTVGKNLLGKSNFHRSLISQVGELEFIKMVEFLTLEEISDKQFEQLHSLFCNHAKEIRNREDGSVQLVLTREELKSLMAEVGHPEDEFEMDCIMHEWDIEDSGYLPFDSFISVVSTFMKIERLDIKMEEDFLRLCGLSDEEIKAENSEAKKHHEITKETLLAAHKKHGDRYTKMNIDIAEEMIYDADLDMVDQNVSIDEFLNAIEMVGSKEIEDLADSDSVWRLPSGRHLSIKNIDMLLGEGGHDDLLGFHLDALAEDVDTPH